MSSEDQTVPAAHDPRWLVELQGLLLSADGLDAFLDELAAATVRALPEAAACGVTLQPDGRPRTVAASGSLAMQVDEVQYRLGDGPCIHAMRTGEVTHIPDSAAEDRWSQFCIEALAYGVRSVLSTPLRVLDTTVGALNLYATTLDAFDSQSRAHAAEFAEYAAGAAGLALRMARQVEASADLRTMLESRSVIDQAVGIVMGQQHCTPDEAFAVLRQASQNRNIKIQAVAAGIIAGVTGTPPRAARFTPRD